MVGLAMDGHKLEEFESLVLDSIDFDVGYFSGKVRNSGSLKKMIWRRCMTTWKKSVTYCGVTEGAQQPPEQKCKRSANQDAPKSKQFELETKVQDIVTQLKDIHGDNFTAPQLRT